jgi:hypothetical protein
MHCNPIEGDLYAEHKVQRLVLNLVVDERQRPWSIEEIGRAIAGKHSAVEIRDALAQLRVIGLIHEAGEVVFASQAAAHIDRLEMLSI